MSEISEFADRHIFPSVFENADKIFPEFEFKRKGNHWVSGNGRKIDGSEGEKGKVYYYQNKPYRFEDVTRSCPGAITTYLIEQHGCATWIDAIKRFARDCGISIPDQHLTEEQIKKAEEKYHKIRFYESINDYFVSCLNDENSKEALAHREYIKDRGYDGHDLGLGFIPSQESLNKHLSSLGFTQDEMNKLFFDSVNYFIGSSHQLTIPFRDHKDDLVSFVFRDIRLEKGNKYLFMTGFKKNDYLFNLKNNRKNKSPLVLVEGFPDSMTSHIHDMDNVVALGGVSISDEQIKLIKESGAEKIILCLDGDKSGVEAIPHAINKILASGVILPLYVVYWPDSCSYKDPDELIKAEGIDSFKLLIENAKSYFNYLVSNILENSSDNISDQDRDTIIKSLISIGCKIKNPADRDSFVSEIDQKGAHLKISRNTLQAEIERERQKREDKKQVETITKELEAASSSLKHGDTKSALEILGNISKHKNIGLSDSYESLLTPITEDAIRDHIRNKPDHLSSRLRIDGEELLIPSGGITIVAAPTSHGKTSVLINLGINIAEEITNKPVYLFSYEESREAILLKALNTYINLPLSKNNRRSIESYFKTSDMGFMSSDNDCRSKFIYEKDKFFRSLIHSGKLNILYSDYTSDDLIGAIHYLHKHGKIGAVLIDYIQLLRLKNNKAGSRQEELKQICLDLKDCAVETGLPIILGSQFNRTVTEKAAVHPTAIGEAGDIERIANTIIGLWNNQFPDLGDKSHKPEPSIYAKILKGRDINVGAEETFAFDGNTGKISNRTIKRF